MQKKAKKTNKFNFVFIKIEQKKGTLFWINIKQILLILHKNKTKEKKTKQIQLHIMNNMCYMNYFVPIMNMLALTKFICNILLMKKNYSI